MSEKLSDIIRVGIVDGVNEQEGTVRVTFPDKDDQVMPDIPLMCDEQNYPSVGDSVLCLFLPNGTEQGFCLGGYYHDGNPPPVKDKEVYVKKLDEGLTIKYDHRIKELTIDAVNDVVINGDLRVNGLIKNEVTP